jgi:SAM-dependent methyltransferase
MTTDAVAGSGFQIGNDAASVYDHHQRPIMAPFVRALVEAARPGPGASVLDLACGTGFAARAASELVESGGEVHGVDVNAGMIEVARRRASTDAPGIRWHVAAAESLPFEDGSFDVVLCQQGFQFFSDVDTAAGEMHRVLRPGGRAAATVWADLAGSPYFVAQYEAVTGYLGRDATASFLAAFESAPRVMAALRRAGFGRVTSSEVAEEVDLPSIADFAAGQMQGTPWGSAVRERWPEGPEATGAAVARALELYAAGDGSVRVPFSATLMTAERPRAG